MSGSNLLERDRECPDCGATIKAGTPLRGGGIHWELDRKRWAHDKPCPAKPAAGPAPTMAVASAVAPSTAVTPTGGSALAPIYGFTQDQVELIKEILAPRAKLTNDELALFLYTARRLGLDPLAKQIYCVKYKIKKGGETLSLQTSIDGYRSIAARTGALDGIAEAKYGPEVESDGGQYPAWASVSVYRVGASHPFVGTARWREYRRLNFDEESRTMKLGEFWRDKPYLMLGKCAEALALRRAFPADLSGVYTEDEMEQAENRELLSGPPRPRQTTAVDADFKEVPPSAGPEEPDPRLVELRELIPMVISALANEFDRTSGREQLKGWLSSHNYETLGQARNADVAELEKLGSNIAGA